MAWAIRFPSTVFHNTLQRSEKRSQLVEKAFSTSWHFFAGENFSTGFFVLYKETSFPAYPLFSPHRMDQQEAGSESVLKGNMEERAQRLAQYIIENRTTVRAAAQKFGISKSTVHKDISERLPQFNRVLFLQVKEVLEVNKAQRHIRGGIATRKKYRGE